MPSCHLPLPLFLNTVLLCLGRSGTMHAGYWICIYASRAHGARYVKASKSLVSLNSTQLEEYNVHSMSASIIVLAIYLRARDYQQVRKRPRESITTCALLSCMLFDRYVRESTNCVPKPT